MKTLEEENATLVAQVDELEEALSSLVRECLADEWVLSHAGRLFQQALSEAEELQERLHANRCPKPDFSTVSLSPLLTFVSGERSVQVPAIPLQPVTTRQTAAALLGVAYHEVRLCLSPSATAGAASL